MLKTFQIEITVLICEISVYYISLVIGESVFTEIWVVVTAVFILLKVCIGVQINIIISIFFLRDHHSHILDVLQHQN